MATSVLKSCWTLSSFICRSLLSTHDTSISLGNTLLYCRSIVYVLQPLTSNSHLSLMYYLRLVFQLIRDAMISAFWYVMTKSKYVHIQFHPARLQISMMLLPTHQNGNTIYCATIGFMILISLSYGSTTLMNPLFV